MRRTQAESDVEQNFQIALKRAAAFHYKMYLLRKAFHALDTYRNNMRPIRDAYEVMTQNHISHIRSLCFREWLSLTQDILQTRRNTQLADQFRLSVLAARALDSWQRFTRDAIAERQQQVCLFV